MKTALKPLVLAALAAFSWASVSAQETKLRDKDAPPAEATIDQMDWLVGRWSGTGIGGAPAHESWLPPVGTTMVGTFVQEDGESGIQFSEHMYLIEEGGSLVMRLKHFNADLTAWEDKEGMVTFPLIELEPCAAYFRSLTLRCTTPDEGEGGLVVAVRMQSGGELLFTFERTAAEQERVLCPDAISTPEMRECNGERLKRADARRQLYLRKVIEVQGDRTAVVEKIRESAIAFEAYRDAECNATRTDVMDDGGTIGPLFITSCLINLSDKRTHTIWGNWLIPMADSEPPFLPEPEPTP